MARTLFVVITFTKFQTAISFQLCLAYHILFLRALLNLLLYSRRNHPGDFNAISSNILWSLIQKSVFCKHFRQFFFCLWDPATCNVFARTPTPQRHFCEYMQTCNCRGYRDAGNESVWGVKKAMFKELCIGVSNLASLHVSYSSYMLTLILRCLGVGVRSNIITFTSVETSCHAQEDGTSCTPTSAHPPYKNCSSTTPYILLLNNIGLYQSLRWIRRGWSCPKQSKTDEDEPATASLYCRAPTIYAIYAALICRKYCEKRHKRQTCRNATKNFIRTESESRNSIEPRL